LPPDIASVAPELDPALAAQIPSLDDIKIEEIVVVEPPV
jgi:hypothetical protein